jgi:hypothetical protein
MQVKQQAQINNNPKVKKVKQNCAINLERGVFGFSRTQSLPEAIRPVGADTPDRQQCRELAFPTDIGVFGFSRTGLR